MTVSAACRRVLSTAAVREQVIKFRVKMQDLEVISNRQHLQTLDRMVRTSPPIRTPAAAAHDRC